MAIADTIALALSDAFEVVGTTFIWNGNSYGCVINADQNTLVTSKRLFGANQLPFVGDRINLAGKDRQVTGVANSVEELVAGGLSGDVAFVDDPANPSLAISFSSFLGKG